MKRVLITGGASGIGAAVVGAFIEKGYEVTLSYNNSEPKIEGIDSAVEVIKCDLSSSLSVDQLCKYIQANQPDIFVNNAAISIKTAYEDISVDELRRVLEVNVVAAFRLCQSAFSSMRRSGGGKIINIGSIAAQLGGKDQVHYAVSKGAVQTLIKSLARLGFEHRIYAYDLSLGCVETKMLRQLHDDMGRLASTIPFGDLGSAEEVAEIVASLCTTQWDYASGQSIKYNGGMLL